MIISTMLNQNLRYIDDISGFSRNADDWPTVTRDSKREKINIVLTYIL